MTDYVGNRRVCDRTDAGSTVRFPVQCQTQYSPISTSSTITWLLLYVHTRSETTNNEMEKRMENHI